MNQESRIKKNIFTAFLVFGLFIPILSIAQEKLSDIDFDDISDDTDLCPTIPGNGSPSGCPIFERRAGEANTDNAVKVRWLDKRPDLILHEKKEVQLGDIIWTVIKNPKTGEVYRKSKGFGAME